MFTQIGWFIIFRCESICYASQTFDIYPIQWSNQKIKRTRDKSLVSSCCCVLLKMNFSICWWTQYLLDCVPGSEGDDGCRADKTPSAGGWRAEEAEEEAERHWPPQVSTTYEFSAQLELFFTSGEVFWKILISWLQGGYFGLKVCYLKTFWYIVMFEHMRAV